MCVIAYIPGIAVFGDMPIYVGPERKNSGIQMFGRPLPTMEDWSLLTQTLAPLNCTNRPVILFSITYITLMIPSGHQATYFVIWVDGTGKDSVMLVKSGGFLAPPFESLCLRFLQILDHPQPNIIVPRTSLGLLQTCYNWLMGPHCLPTGQFSPEGDLLALHAPHCFLLLGSRTTPNACWFNTTHSPEDQIMGNSTCSLGNRGSPNVSVDCASVTCPSSSLQVTAETF